MISDFFVHGYKIYRPQFINDGGISKKHYSLVKTISGRMRPMSGNELLRSMKLGFNSTDKFYAGIEDIQINDIIEDLNSKFYDVTYIKNPMNMNHHLEIDCRFNPDNQNLTIEGSSS